MERLRRRLTASWSPLVIAALLLIMAESAYAHGGRFQGPGGRAPPGDPTTPSPSGPKRGAPVVTPGSGVLQELWAPNHRWVEVASDMLSPIIADACDPLPPEWRIASCSSDEPIDGRGDGRTGPDCLVSDDGLSVSVRAERSGRGEGRSYELAIIAGDACGNWSSPVPIGSVRVRHDRSR